MGLLRQASLRRDVRRKARRGGRAGPDGSPDRVPRPRGASMSLRGRSTFNVVCKLSALALRKVGR
jgi:hypothetical protein